MVTFSFLQNEIGTDLKQKRQNNPLRSGETKVVYPLFSRKREMWCGVVLNSLGLWLSVRGTNVEKRDVEGSD